MTRKIAISRGERDALRLMAAMREMIRSERSAEAGLRGSGGCGHTGTGDAIARRVPGAAGCAHRAQCALIDNLLIEERDGEFQVTL